MKCLFCSYGESKVLDKRETGDRGEVTRRRRECLRCKKRYTTYERIEVSPIMVVKKDGRRELFDRSKIRTGLMKACEKRPVSQQEIDQLVEEIEAKVMAQERAELPSKTIGELVMRRLRTFDKVAYVRFASVYRQFEDVTSFEDTLRSLLKKKRSKR